MEIEPLCCVSYQGIITTYCVTRNHIIHGSSLLSRVSLRKTETHILPVKYLHPFSYCQVSSGTTPGTLIQLLQTPGWDIESTLQSNCSRSRFPKVDVVDPRLHGVLRLQHHAELAPGIVPRRAPVSQARHPAHPIALWGRPRKAAIKNRRRSANHGNGPRCIGTTSPQSSSHWLSASPCFPWIWTS